MKTPIHHFLRRATFVALATSGLALSGCGDNDSPASAKQSEAPKAEKAETSAMSDMVPNGLMNSVVNGEKVLLRMRHLVNEDGSWDSAGFWRPAPMNSASVSFFGLGGSMHKATGKNDMRLSFIVTDLNGVPKIMEPELSYFPAGLSHQWDSSSTSDVKVTLYKVQVNGDILEIGGSFSGTVKYANEGREPKEGFPETYKIEQGVFDVKLYRHK